MSRREGLRPTARPRCLVERAHHWSTENATISSRLPHLHQPRPATFQPRIERYIIARFRPEASLLNSSTAVGRSTDLNILVTPTSNTTTLSLQHKGINKPTGSSATCGTSHSTGLSATGARKPTALFRTTRCPEADLFARNLAEPLRLSGQPLPGGGLTRCLTGSLRNSGQPAVQDGSTHLQLHGTTLRMFADRLPRHPGASNRPPTPHCS